MVADFASSAADRLPLDVDARVQALGDVTGAQATTDEIEHLQLAIGKELDRRTVRPIARFGNAAQQPLGNVLTHVDLAFEDLAYRPDHPRRGFLLVDVAHRSGTQGAFREQVQQVVHLAIAGVIGGCKSVGVFQVESRAQMATLPRLRYDQLMDLGWKVLIPVTIVWIVGEGVAIGLGWQPWLS